MSDNKTIPLVNTELLATLTQLLSEAEREREAHGLDYIVITQYSLASVGRCFRQKYAGKWYITMRKETWDQCMESLPVQFNTFPSPLGSLMGIPVLEDDELGKTLLRELGFPIIDPSRFTFIDLNIGIRDAKSSDFVFMSNVL